MGLCGGDLQEEVGEDDNRETSDQAQIEFDSISGVIP